MLLKEPVYHRIKAKYKLIVTLEYITVRSEWRNGCCKLWLCFMSYWVLNWHYINLKLVKMDIINIILCSFLVSWQQNGWFWLILLFQHLPVKLFTAFWFTARCTLMNEWRAKWRVALVCTNLFNTLFKKVQLYSVGGFLHLLTWNSWKYATLTELYMAVRRYGNTVLLLNAE